MSGQGSSRLLQPLVQESTPGRVARVVRAAIAHGEIAPGEQLGEVDLARRLGVSRGPLREGLQRLTQEGLLVSHRNRGLFVVEMTPQRIADTYLAREVVERGAAAHVHAQGLGDDAGTRLLEDVEAMQRAAEADDVETLTGSDLRFHETLVAASGSARLISMHATLMTETRMCLNALIPTYRRHAERLEEHEDIARAFVAGDAELTDRLLRAHMQDGLARLQVPR